MNDGVFDLEKLFVDVFAPQPGDVLAMLVDLPHGPIADNDAWRARRRMAEDWHHRIGAFAPRHGIRLDALVTDEATGSHNADLPEHGMRAGAHVRLDEVCAASTIATRA